MAIPDDLSIQMREIVWDTKNDKELVTVERERISFLLG